MRPGVLWCFQFVDVTRGHLTMPWVASLSSSDRVATHGHCSLVKPLRRPRRRRRGVAAMAWR